MNWQPGWTSKERYLNIENFPGEKWKPLIEWKGKVLKPYYEISDLGRLKSKFYSTNHKILPGTLDVTTGGYIATLVRSADDTQVSFSYHQAVARYFISDPPEYMINPVVDHIDSDKLNNRVSNLQWLEMADNTKKALNEGRCEIFRNNGGWNKQSCHFIEYPEVIFKSLAEAAHFIGRNSDYVAECLRLDRNIKDKVRKCIVHVVIEEESLDVRAKYTAATCSNL